MRTWCFPRAARAGLDVEALEAEQVVAVLEASVLGVQGPAAECAALGDDDAVGARPSGSTTSAVTAWDLFFRLSTEFSLRRPMPPNSSCELPLINVRAAGEVRVEALDAAVVQRQHVVLDRLDQEQPLQLVQLVRAFRLARLCACVQSSGA